MKGYNFPYKFRIFIFLIVFFLSLHFSSNLSDWKGNSTIWSLSSYILYPFEYIWHKTSKNIIYIFDKYVNLINLKEKNNELINQNKNLQYILIAYKDKLNYLSKSNNLLSIAKKYKIEIILAEISNYSIFQHFQSFRILAGKKKGVFENMIVIGENTLLGKVIRSNIFYSDVQLITDIDFSILGIVERSRIRGIVKGTGRKYMQMKLDKYNDIQIGDRVLTFGNLKNTPSSIPIGNVIKIEYNIDKTTKIITLKPYFKYNQQIAVVKKY